MTGIERDCLSEIACAMEDWLDRLSDLHFLFSQSQISAWFPEWSYVAEALHYLEGILWEEPRENLS